MMVVKKSPWNGRIQLMDCLLLPIILWSATCTERKRRARGAAERDAVTYEGKSAISRIVDVHSGPSRRCW